MRKQVMVATALLACPALAHAHGMPAAGFLSGVRHPVLGFDHFLAMLSVGVLSAQIGGRAIWTVPSAFVFTMLVGGVLGMWGVPMLSVEMGIAFSVFALGIAVAADRRMPVLVAMLFVATFAIFHGHAHGTEMPNTATPVAYALGFILGTAGIHVGGVFVGLAAKQTPRASAILRLSGGLMAAVGVYLMIRPG